MKRFGLFTVLAVFAFALTAASGATLGALSTTQIGSSSTTVSGCTTSGMVVRYTTTVVSNASYKTTQVNLSSIPPSCVGVGKTVSAALSDGGATVATGSATITSGTTANIVLSPTTTDTSALNRVAIVFTG